MANFIDDFMKTYGSEVTQQMSSSYGIDRGTVQKLIPQLAPQILGALSKRRDTGGSGGIGGISSLNDADGECLMLNFMLNMLNKFKSKECETFISYFRFCN